MRTFHCSHCHHQVFFENTECLNCHRRLAYVPESNSMLAFRGDSEGRYRLCANRLKYAICNWAVADKDATTLCLSCQLTRRVSTSPADRPLWAKMEGGKRRLVANLLALGLPVVSKLRHTDGVCFDFPAERSGRDTALTGHLDGVITINLSEADDVRREAERQRHHEPYRTLLGHFRHEIGHYYWDLLIRDTPRLQRFRALFGDERADYAAALTRHYENGPRPGWQARHISAYASVHPWEDWAESWAHLMHMLDLLERWCDRSLLTPTHPDEPTVERFANRRAPIDWDFETIISRWTPVTYLMNTLNRSMGLSDGYPFVLNDVALAKLQFIFDLLRAGETRADAGGVQRPGMGLLAGAACAGILAAVGALADRIERES